MMVVSQAKEYSEGIYCAFEWLSYLSCRTQKLEASCECSFINMCSSEDCCFLKGEKTRVDLRKSIFKKRVL